MCERMKDFFPILKNTNVYGLIRTILNCSLVFQEYNPFGHRRGWIFIKNNHEDNKCKQWILNIHDVYNYSMNTIYNYIVLSITSYLKNLNKILINFNEFKKKLKHYFILKLFCSFDDRLSDRLDRLLELPIENT